MTYIYKVVVIDTTKKDSYLSVCSRWYSMANCALTYRIGQVTKPNIKNSKIFAFDDLERAISFGKANVKKSRMAVLKCEASVDKDIKLNVVSMLSFTNVLQFWKEKIYKRYHRRMLDDWSSPWHVIGAPRDTVCCDWVKPVDVAYSQENDNEHTDN